MSRAFEREAEWRGPGALGRPDAAIGLQQGLVERSLGVPDPPAAIRVWFGTHPTALERIGMALRARDGRLSWAAASPRLQIACVGRLRPPHDAPGRLYQERVRPAWRA